MEMKKRRLWLIVSAVLSVVILLLTIVLRNNRPSHEYQEYEAWAATFQTQDWTLTEDTVKDFGESNCPWMLKGYPPGWIIQNADHLKATSAVFEVYCPKALDKYLDFVDHDDRYNNLASTTALIRKETSR
jgi:hypothetical protein